MTLWNRIKSFYPRQCRPSSLCKSRSQGGSPTVPLFFTVRRRLGPNLIDLTFAENVWKRKIKEGIFITKKKTNCSALLNTKPGVLMNSVYRVTNYLNTYLPALLLGGANGEKRTSVVLSNECSFSTILYLCIFCVICTRFRQRTTQRTFIFSLCS